MAINFPPDLDGISAVHKPERLQTRLLDKDLPEITLEIYFEVETRLPSGKLVGQPYLDTTTPLYLSCKDNPELAQAMQVMQNAIGIARYKQFTTPKDKETILPSDS